MNPSYRIVFYVSGHGFGHTARAIEVIRALLRARSEAQIIVKTSAPLGLFGGALEGRCELVTLACDAGMAQTDSLNLDAQESVRRAVAFQTRVPALVAAEASYLRDSGACVAVGDIPPLAVAAAHVAGIPSVAIGNFTWDWIYENYRDAAAPALALATRRLYQDATIALRLPMAGGFAGLESITRDIPFIARRSSRTRDEVRHALGLPVRAGGKPLVLMAFGGHGIAGLDNSALGGLKEFTIATTAPSARGPGTMPATPLLYISEERMRHAGLCFADLVRGADVVVTKPGYGIISEAIANGSALLYTSRGEFVEYDVLVKEMPRYLRVRFIEQGDLLSGNWREGLEKLLNQPAAPQIPELNGADVAAAEILRHGSPVPSPTSHHLAPSERQKRM